MNARTAVGEEQGRTRVCPQDPAKVAAAVRPDDARGSRVATLGLAYSTPAMGTRFTDGIFAGEHGSWNRNPPSGYRVQERPITNDCFADRNVYPRASPTTTPGGHGLGWRVAS